MRRALITSLLWLCSVPCVGADDRVILLERAGLRPELCAALRIQLADAAEVSCEPEPEAVLPDRIAHAARRVKEEQARVGLFLERDPDPELVRMYIVSAQSDQAVVSIERIEDRPEPDVDRSLAIKVRDAYFVIEQVRALPQPPLAALVAPPPATATAVPLAEPPPSAPGYEVWLDVGGGLSAGSGMRALLAATLGVGRTSGAWRWEVGLGGRLLSDDENTRRGARVVETERGPVIGLRTLHVGKRFAVGAALEPALWFTRARGTAATGEQGRADHKLPSLSLGLDARVRLFASAWLRFAPAVEWLTTRQRYAVEDEVVTDLGRLRVLLPLSLALGLPVTGASTGGAP